MRFMVIVKASQASEAGGLPNAELLAEMAKFNEQLVNAGVMLAGDGLHASSRGARVAFSGEKRTVTSGPFPETNQLVAGYWVWKLGSIEDAIAWLKRAPFHGGEVEIRQLFDPEDFGRNLTPELKQQEVGLRGRMAGNQ